jgi:YfiH family protein
LAFLLSSNLASLPWVEHGFGTRDPLPAGFESASLNQIHSDLVVMPAQTGRCGDGDALVSNRAGLTVSIRTADCYPVLLADTRRRTVAAIHAGWRGTAAHIVEKTLSKMQAEFGTDPTDVLAAIGPGIGVCCYEVGEEVARQFGLSGRTHLDLALENRRQLERAGVPPGKIEALGVCTLCDAERFFSYRREREAAGRMVSYIRFFKPA